MSTEYKIYNCEQKIVINNHYYFSTFKYSLSYLPKFDRTITAQHYIYTTKEEIRNAVADIPNASITNSKLQFNKFDIYYNFKNIWEENNSIFNNTSNIKFKADDITSLVVIFEYTEIKDKPISYYRDNLSAEDFLHYCHDIYKSFDEIITEV